MEKIDEKIKFKEIVLALGVFLGAWNATDYILKDYNNYQFAKKLYNIVNSDISRKDQKIIINIKRDLINEVKKSNLFDKFNKSYILDSIENATIRIIDIEKFHSGLNSDGFFIHLPDIKDMAYVKYLDKPSKDNIIIIDKNIAGEHFIETLVHELYHYIDLLYSGDYKNYSDNIKYSDYLDKKIIDLDFDELYIEEKLLKYFEKDIIDLMIKTGLVESYKDTLKDQIKYYTSNKELFARINTLMYGLKKYNCRDLKEYVNKKIDDDKYIDSDIILILVLDPDKLDDLLEIHK